MNIHIASGDAEVNACYSVMRELRPHITAERFLTRVRDQATNGYLLAMMQVQDNVVAVAGFRISENLAWGRFLYVDDLVTSQANRSKGYGSALLAWLKVYANAEGCAQLHLDSGMQRTDAHRFYLREGMSKTGFHFAEALETGKAP